MPNRSSLPRIVAALLVGLTVAAAPARAQDTRAATLREYLAAAAALGHLNGSILVAERGTILVDTAYGFANMELGVRNTPETRFRVASVSKQFTAMAVLMLAADGKLRVSDPISMYLDSLPSEWSGITIHHLLRHTSGISDYEGWFGGYSTQAYSDYMSQEHAAERIARDARRRPLDFEPGSKFSYSNSAYILLGFIIERAAGMPYEQFLHERIMVPVGMMSSAQDRSDLITPGRAQGYQLREGAYPIAYFNGLARTDYRNAVYQLMEPPQADAGLITTARDLYKWDQALYTDDLIARAMLDSMFTPGLGHYGYGWFINNGKDGVTHEHSGGLPGFGCYIMRIPDSQRTIILLGNLGRTGRTVRDVAAIMRGEGVAMPKARHVVENDSARDAALAGWYRISAGDSVRAFQEDGGFGLHWPEHFRVQLLAESDGNYFAAQLGGVARFSRSAGGMTLVVEDALGEPLLTALRTRGRDERE